MKLALCLVLLLAITSCSRVAPFEKKEYKGLDGTQALKFLSSTELEATDGGTNLLCKYSKDGDRLRVVMQVMGTTEVIYFEQIPEGFRDKNGAILYSPPEYTKALQARDFARQKQEEARKNIAAEIETSRKVNRQVATFPLDSFGSVSRQHFHSPNQITITDVGVQLRYPDNEPTEPADFADLTTFEDIRTYSYEGQNFMFYLSWHTPDDSSGKSSNISCKDRTRTESIKEVFLRTFEEWSRKFPHARRRDLRMEAKSASKAHGDSRNLVLIADRQGRTASAANEKSHVSC